jgi:hypothetical protein
MIVVVDFFVRSLAVVTPMLGTVVMMVDLLVLSLAVIMSSFGAMVMVVDFFMVPRSVMTVVNRSMVDMMPIV